MHAVCVSERVKERGREREGASFSANVKTNATPPTCSRADERILIGDLLREHVNNSVGIDELVTLILFPYIVGLSEQAVNSRRALFMRSARRGGGEEGEGETRSLGPRGRPGPFS